MTHENSMTEKEAKPRSKYRKPALIIAAIFFLIIAILWLLYYLIWGQFYVYTDDAYVNGNLVQLNSQIAGTVIEINTDDTFYVEKGEVLIKLDPSDATVALQTAESELAQTVRKVRQYYENAKQAQSTLIANEADLNKASLDYNRRKGLVDARALSAEEFQHYQTAYETAQARYNVALATLRSSLALVENTSLYTHPEVERAIANYKFHYLNYVRTTIYAPVSGIVAKRNVQVGQQVTMSTPLLAIVPLAEAWVDANYKESQIDYIRIGQPVTLHADAYPEVIYHGKVVGLNAGTGAAFALLPAQNATGNWIKIVQRLPVRIGMNKDELKKHPLMIGLSMGVTIDIHDTSGRQLVTRAKDKAIYETNIFEKQLADANAQIQRILRANGADIKMSRNEIIRGRFHG